MSAAGTIKLPSHIRDCTSETALLCIECGEATVNVVDSRAAGDGRLLRRRRMCRSCGHRWTTWEGPEQPVYHDGIVRRARELAATCRDLARHAEALRRLVEDEDDLA